MENIMINVFFVILAAGKGTRMNAGRPSPVPKVLIPLGGKPMVSYILETLNNLRPKTENLRQKISNQENTSEVEEVPHFGSVGIGKQILGGGSKGELVKKAVGAR